MCARPFASVLDGVERGGPEMDLRNPAVWRAVCVYGLGATIALGADAPSEGGLPPQAGGRTAGAGLSPVHKSPSVLSSDLKGKASAKMVLARNNLETVCGVRFAVNGNLARVFVPTVESKFSAPKMHKNDAERGEIGEFTHKSRRRLLNRLNSIDRKAIPPENVWFVTLTYPLEWQADYRVWKRHLEALWKRFLREYRDEYGVDRPGCFFPVAASLIWKLEFQIRDAPHFHCLLIWMERTPAISAFREWLALNWAQVVAGRRGVVDDKHHRAGTGCDRAEKWGGVSSYAAKYCSKQTQQVIDFQTGEIKPNGRWWGCKELKALPITLQSERLTEEQALTVRRILQKKNIAEARGAEKPCWKVVQRRKNRRGWRVTDETFYVLDETVRRLIAWVRHAKGGEEGFVESTTGEIVRSLGDGDVPVDAWEVG